MAEDDQVERFLGQPEVLIGLIPGGGTQMLARSLGVARALELCLEGQLLEPRQALRWAWSTGWRRRSYWKPPTLAQRLSGAAAGGAPDQAFDLPGGFPRLDGGYGQRKAGFSPPPPAPCRAMREYIERVRTITREERPFRRADFDDLTGRQRHRHGLQVICMTALPRFPPRPG